MAEPVVPGDPGATETGTRTAEVTWVADDAWQDCVGCEASIPTYGLRYVPQSDEYQEPWTGSVDASDLLNAGDPASPVVVGDPVANIDGPADATSWELSFVSLSAAVNSGTCGPGCEPDDPCAFTFSLVCDAVVQGQADAGTLNSGTSTAPTLTYSDVVGLGVVEPPTVRGTFNSAPVQTGSSPDGLGKFINTYRYTFTIGVSVTCGEQESDANLFRFDMKNISAGTSPTTGGGSVPGHWPLGLSEANEEAGVPTSEIKVYLSCTACEKAADEMVVEGSTDGGNTWTVLGTGPSAAESLTLSGLLPDTSYMLRLSVVGGSGTSPYAEASFATMTFAEELWAAVKVSYDAEGLITLTNIRDRSATAIDDLAGEDAAQGVIDLWPVYAQAAYDGTNATHVEIGKRATVAMLWQRGGTSTNIAKVEWDEVWGDSGLVGRLRKSEARAHASPSSNTGTVRSSELLSNGQQTRPWSDPASYPIGLRSSRRPVYGD